jgi:uncharacterized protein YpbB
MINKAEAMVNSAYNNLEFSKEKINTVEENKERVASLSEIVSPAAMRERGRKTKGPKEKKEKVDTKRISYDLFRSGKTIEEIAAERNMAFMTIEGHLAHYAGLGLIDVKQFVSEEKINHIITVAKALDTTLFGAIKQSLGEEYSYTEIKFAMAWYQNSKK